MWEEGSIREKEGGKHGKEGSIREKEGGKGDGIFTQAK